MKSIEDMNIGLSPEMEAELLTYNNPWTEALGGARGEQPDGTALPDAGALRGDIPLASSEKEIK